jgi:hypothetical protein
MVKQFPWAGRRTRQEWDETLGAIWEAALKAQRWGSNAARGVTGGTVPRFYGVTFSPKIRLPQSGTDLPVFSAHSRRGPSLNGCKSNSHAAKYNNKNQLVKIEAGKPYLCYTKFDTYLSYMIEFFSMVKYGGDR